MSQTLQTIANRWQQPARPTRPDWWLRTADGRLVLAQPPNAPALVGSIGGAVSRLPLMPPPARLGLRVASEVALAWWALGEARSGATPARAAIGVLTLAGQAGRLAKAVRSGPGQG